MRFIDRVRLMSEIRRAKALLPAGTKRTIKPPPGHPDLLNWELQNLLRATSRFGQPDLSKIGLTTEEFYERISVLGKAGINRKD